MKHCSHYSLSYTNDPRPSSRKKDSKCPSFTLRSWSNIMGTQAHGRKSLCFLGKGRGDDLLG